MARKQGSAGVDFQALLGRIRDCRLCLDDPDGAPLPHQPRPVLRVQPSATLLIAGQAPGTRVHATGLPFNDPSGDRLRDWLGVDGETFYDSSRIAIVPMGFCFPGQNTAGADLPPRRECVAAWHDELFARLPGLRLKLAIGGYAHAYHLGKLAAPNVTETVGRWRQIGEATASETGIRVIPLPHPSWRNSGWLKKNPWFSTELLPELRRHVRTELERRDQGSAPSTTGRSSRRDHAAIEPS
jgi:uracil-DNA glycosylase